MEIIACIKFNTLSDTLSKKLVFTLNQISIIPAKLITIKYNEFESNNNNEIRSMKQQIKTGATDKYEIYYEYDEDGFINKAVIEEVRKEDINANLDNLLNKDQKAQMSDFEKNRFNSTFENLYFGSTAGGFMDDFIDAVIKSNQKNPEHIIIVSYNGTETSDANELRSMKKKFSNNVKYEIIYDYDENGLINKAKIEK